MNMGSITLLLLLGGSACFRLDAARTTANKYGKGGRHKCTITWPREGTWPEDRAETPASTVSFGVDSCAVRCKATVDSDHFDSVFAVSFRAVQKSPRRCSCQTLEGRELFKFVGSCGNTHEEKQQAQKTCFHHYKKVVTNELKAHAGRRAITVVPHMELHREDTFDYSCQKDACEGSANCLNSKLHTQWETRSEQEKKLLADLVSKVANADDLSDLSSEAKQLVGELGAEDIQNAGELAIQENRAGEPGFEARLESVKKYGADLIEEEEDEVEDSIGASEQWEEEAQGLFNEIVETSENQDGTITVQELKNKYAEILEGTAVHIPSLLKLAGIEGDVEHVTFEQFKRFVKPNCN